MGVVSPQSRYETEEVMRHDNRRSFPEVFLTKFLYNITVPLLSTAIPLRSVILKMNLPLLRTPQNRGSGCTSRITLKATLTGERRRLILRHVPCKTLCKNLLENSRPNTINTPTIPKASEVGLMTSETKANKAITPMQCSR
eukprot:GHVN01100434.1.p2 GENE.GHVN01100434.1~~GHVN01100434.1.p2  ORF type:complete len:141 (-),score=18.09 GHVN01100434.1:235-657(-)